MPPRRDDLVCASAEDHRPGTRRSIGRNSRWGLTSDRTQRRDAV